MLPDTWPVRLGSSPPISSTLFPPRVTEACVPQSLPSLTNNRSENDSGMQFWLPTFTHLNFTLQVPAMGDSAAFPGVVHASDAKKNDAMTAFIARGAGSGAFIIWDNGSDP